MKPLYVKKNGTVNKVSGVAMPNTYPANRVGYDNTASELEATNTQDAIDEVVDIVADKVDKVSSATNGNLAGLDSNGNLTDAGWSSDKTSTSVTGNPISISGLKSNQLAMNPVITLEPIQAGSGDPSPSNIRAISGYDKIEVLSTGRNIWGGEKFADDIVANTTGATKNVTNKSVYFQDYHHTPEKPLFDKFKPNTQYTFIVHVASVDSAGNTSLGFKYTDNTMTLFNISLSDANSTLVFQSNANKSISYLFAGYYTNGTVEIKYEQCGLFEGVLQALDFIPYHKTTDLSLTLGQTVYGGTLDVEKGILTVDREGVDLGTLNWARTNTADSHWEFYSDSLATECKFPVEAQITHTILCSHYTEVSADDVYSGSFGIAINISVYKQILICDENYSDAATFKTAMNGVQLVYELATPYTIQLTPHEISLLKDYAYVSTNGTNMSFSYKNGELASLGDVSQVGETVNGIADIVSTENSAIDAVVNVYSGKNLIPYPYYEVSSYTANGVTFTYDSDGIITLNNTAANKIYYALSTLLYNLKSGNYILSGGINGANLLLSINDKNTQQFKRDVYQYIDPVEVVLASDEYINGMYIVVSSGASFSNAIVYPMIRDARISDPTYAPYAMTNRELTEKVADLSEKSVTLTSNGNIDTSPYVFKKKGGVIVGNGYIMNIPLVAGTPVQLGTLDTNYAPLDTIRVSCAVSDYAYNPPQAMGFLSINTDGTIYLNANLTGTYTCYFNVSYIN